MTFGHWARLEEIGDVHEIVTFLLDKRDGLKQFNNSERRWSHPS